MKWIQSLKPIQLLIYGYVSILLIGFILLCLPFVQNGQTATIDHLFIATSALSTTGLASVNILESYNFWGQVIILLLIQIGGLGFMSIGSFFIIMREHRLSHKNSELVKTDFSLPKKFNIYQFIHHLIIFTIIIEILGALALSWIFALNGETNVFWKGLFFSISAFCTAGFSLLSDSFEGYRDNFYLNFVIAILSIAGALGFIVLTDLYEKMSGRKSRLTFTSRIIIRFTFTGIFIGALILFLSDPNIANLKPDDRLLTSLFQSITAFTTVGFNSYPIGEITAAPLFFIMILMFVGASPSGTGGGMKSTTVITLYAQLKSTFHKENQVIYLNRIIPQNKVRLATSKFFFYVIVICFGIFLLLLLEHQNPFDLLFEAISALGTVGLSVGITEQLTNLGKLIIIALMFLGRIGPLSFGLALFSSSIEDEIIIEEDVAI